MPYVIHDGACCLSNFNEKDSAACEWEQAELFDLIDPTHILTWDHLSEAKKVAKILGGWHPFRIFRVYKVREAKAFRVVE